MGLKKKGYSDLRYTSPDTQNESYSVGGYSYYIEDLFWIWVPQRMFVGDSLTPHRVMLVRDLMPHGHVATLGRHKFVYIYI